MTAASASHTITFIVVESLRQSSGCGAFTVSHGMSERVDNQVSTTFIPDQRTSLFLWRGAGIVLFGEREHGRFVLARAWHQGDRLEHVRRWTFAQPIPFSGQVRRLVKEACGDVGLAREEGRRALAWAEAAS